MNTDKTVLMGAFSAAFGFALQMPDRDLPFRLYPCPSVFICGSNPSIETLKLVSEAPDSLNLPESNSRPFASIRGSTLFAASKFAFICVHLWFNPFDRNAGARQRSSRFIESSPEPFAYIRVHSRFYLIPDRA